MQNNTTLKQRLAEFLAYLNIGQAKFAEIVGLSKGFANNVGDSIRTDNLQKITNCYPNLNITWLITGEGDMLKQSNIIQSGEQNINVSGSRNSNTGNRHYAQKHKADSISEELQQSAGIPLIPFDCIAGYGEDNTGIALDNCERYAIPEFENIGAEFLVRVGGSSMYPKYSSGDILACKKIHDILFFQWGKIYVIDSSQGQLIKRVFEHENEDMILLVSDNKEKYPPFPIPKSDIRSLSIVLGVVRME